MSVRCKAGLAGARAAFAAVAAVVLVVLCATPAPAQDEEQQRVGPFVVDLRPAILRAPATQQLADSRGLSLAQIPGVGVGGVGGVHVYPLRWRAITFGIGGEVVVVRGRASPPTGTQALRAVTEHFVSAAPQLSFNFRGSNGWSYLSGGVGTSVWQIIPDGRDVSDADEERLRTVNYGAGARWFIKRHVAFSLDLRVWQVNPGTAYLGHPASPRANLFVISAGVGMR